MAAAGEQLPGGAGRGVGDFGYLGGGIAMHVEEEDGCAALAGYLCQGVVELFVAEAGVGDLVRDYGRSFVERLMGAGRLPVVEEEAISDAVEPRLEFAGVAQAVDRQIGFDVGILRYVVGLLGVAAAQGREEASERFLRGLDLSGEFLACHHRCGFAGSVELIAGYAAHDEEAEADGDHDAAEHEGHRHRVGAYRRAAAQVNEAYDEEHDAYEREDASAKEAPVEALAFGLARLLQRFGYLVGIGTAVFDGFDEDFSAFFVDIHLVDEIGHYDAEREYAADED